MLYYSRIAKLRFLSFVATFFVLVRPNKFFQHRLRI